MGRNKRPSTATDIYNTHLYGQFKNNPINNRVAVIERMYQRILTELAVARFKWTGMPDSIDLRFLEITLFYHALSVFYFDKKLDQYLSLKGGGINWLNHVDNPVGFSVVGNHFVGKNLSAIKETDAGGIAVPIWANALRIPDLDIVTVYAHRFAQLDRTIEINSLNARQSKVLIANDNQSLSISNIDRQYEEGQNVIKVNGVLQDLTFMQALDLGVDSDSHEKLHILKVRLWNECMGLLGIENANQDKKERLVKGETDANDDQTTTMQFVNLNERRRAIENIIIAYPNLKDHNIEVNLNTEIKKRADAAFEASLENTKVEVDA